MTDEELLALMAQQKSEAGPSDDDLMAMMATSDPNAPTETAPAQGEGEWYSGPLHAAKGLGKMAMGVAEMPSMLKNAASYPTRKALNYLGVPEDITDYGRSQGPSEQPWGPQVNEYLDNTPGIEEGSGWDMAQTGAEWGGGGLGSIGRKGVSAIPDAAMAVGAVIGEQLGGETGEVAGGLTGMLSMLRGRGKTKAIDAIQENISGNADDMVEKARAGVESGEVGTLADLTRDQGVMDVEQLVSGGKNTEKYRAVELERQAQIAEQVRNPFGNADPDLARVAGQDRIASMINESIPKRVAKRQQQVEVPLRAEIDAVEQANQIPQAAAVEAGLNQARAQARAGDAMESTVAASRAVDDALAPLQTDSTLAQASAAKSKLVTEAREAQRLADVAPQWKEFDALPAVPVEQYKATIAAFVDGLPESQKIKFSQVSDDFAALKNKKITEMRPVEIQDILRDMNKTIDKAYKSGGDSTAIRNLESLRDALDSQLVEAVPVYGRAKAGETALRARFDGPVVGEARGVEPELFDKTVGMGDEAGAVSGRYIAAADIPGMPEAQAESLRALARRSAKGVDEGFMAQYESVMDTLPPEFQQQARALIDADATLVQAGAAQEGAIKSAEAATKQAQGANTAAAASTKATGDEVSRLKKAIIADQAKAAKRGTKLERSVTKSNLNKYVNDRKGTLTKMLSNPDDVSDLASLKQSMERMGQTDSFNANLGDTIIENLSTKGRGEGLRQATGSAPVLTTAAIPKFNKMAASLVEAGIATTDDMDKIRASLNKLATAEQRAVARKAITGSDGATLDLLASGVSAATLKLLPGSSLVMAGAVRRGIRKAMTKGGINNEAVLNSVDDFMLNPQKYLEALDAANGAQLEQKLMQKIIAASQAAAQD